MFGYVPGMSPVRSHPKAPVIIAPILNRGGKASIDMEAFGGQVIVLHADGSTFTLDATSENEVKNREGQTLFKDGKA